MADLEAHVSQLPYFCLFAKPRGKGPCRAENAKISPSATAQNWAVLDTKATGDTQRKTSRIPGGSLFPKGTPFSQGEKQPEALALRCWHLSASTIRA